MRKHNQGFTLTELMISLVILGLASTVMVTFTKQSQGIWQRANTERQHEANRMTGEALKELARRSSTGVLPTPYTGNGYTSAPYNPSDANAREVFLGQGLSNDLINTDGTPAENRRVYQRVAGLTRNVPVSGLAGDTVTLSYDIGVVYSTDCPLSKKNCFTGGIPGSSTQLTKSNLKTWEPKGNDIRPVWISTFPFQKNLFTETMDRVYTLINKEKEYFQQQVLAAGAGEAKNVHVSPNAGAPSIPGGGCHGGWYNLSLSNVNILNQLGLTAKYGTTAWGKPIEYCRDYDPIGGGANKAPHSAAVRFKSNLSTGEGNYVAISY